MCSVINDKYLIWSYLRCFDHGKKDYGVKEYLEKIGTKPYGIAGLVYHPDFVHLHKGMEEEFTVPPQMFGYRGDPRRLPEETYRKYSWTNYQIKGLVEELHKYGVKFYLSIFGTYYKDTLHKEWLGQHKELLMQTIDGRTEHLVAFKKTNEGLSYEDFFIQKITQTLTDYGMDGVHLGDAFGPLSEGLALGDYTTQMIKQFTEDTGISIPDGIISAMGDDSPEALTKRQKWIWNTYREEWIRFYDRRWTKFYEKLCPAIHAIGCEVSNLGMYISDTLRSMYSMGTDARHITDAGLDFLTPNILPTSVQMNDISGLCSYNGHSLFHRFMTMIPSLKAHAPNAELFHMLGIRDEEEEWDVLYHAPNEFERDLFTAMAYHLVTKDGPKRCISKHLLTIGDSIDKSDWEKVNRLMTSAYSLEPCRVVSPVLYWSETANDRMLTSHIATRRPSHTMLQALIQEYGAFCGGSVISDDIDYYDGVLFVPAFDLISDKERQELADKKRAVVAIAPADFDISAFNVSISFTDNNSNYPHKVFLMNIPAPGDISPFTDALNTADSTPELPPEEELKDENLNVMHEMYMQKVSNGFSKVTAMLFKYADSLNNPFSSESPIMVFKEGENSYRVYVYSRYENGYDRTLVTSKIPMKKVTTLGSFPYKPLKFMDNLVSPTQTWDVAKGLDEASGCSFQLKIQKSGIAVFNIEI